MGNRHWIAAGVLAITGSLLGAPAAAASPLTTMDDDGLLPPIEIRIPGLLELRIGGGQPAADPPADAPSPPATPQPTSTPTPPVTPTPAPGDPTPPPVEPEPEPDAEPRTLETDELGPATTERRSSSRVSTPTEAATTGGITRDAAISDWPAVAVTVQVGAESISIERVRIDDAVTSTLTYAAGGLGLLAAGAAVARWRLLARAERPTSTRPRVAPPRDE